MRVRIYYKVQLAALCFSIVFRFILFRVPSLFFVIHPPGNRHQLLNITPCSYVYTIILYRGWFGDRSVFPEPRFGLFYERFVKLYYRK